MLKAYAMALVLTTAAPVADKAADGAKAPAKANAPVTQIWKPGSVRI
ncbi:hypothetical protein [Bowmanella dokdonensis]|uniref:Uncharacterized protein n=1 Tax=Bowmanella dokdonensis TaxID=751969 RepID=A0A939DQ65_9ALTE|nr:hypothetical protein [Bowmanella dokdonensis]MBN7826760.1 hypothetical protein [Bowmanella dokdonensis]